MNDLNLSIFGEQIEDDDDDCFDLQTFISRDAVVKPLIPAEVHRSHDAIKKEQMPADSERSCQIKIYVTAKERKIIQKAAGRTAVSTWARNQLLRGSGSKYPIEIQTGDISQLVNQLSDYNFHANGFIAGLRYHTELYQSDIDHMVELMETLNCEVKEAVRIIRNDRKFEKKKTEREIKGRLEKITNAYQEQLDAEMAQYGNGRNGRRK